MISYLVKVFAEPKNMCAPDRSGSAYRRRAMNRAQTIAILVAQGAPSVAVDAIMQHGATREKAIWNVLEAQGIAIPCGNFSRCATMIERRSDCTRDHKISLRSVPLDKRAEHDQSWNQWYLCESCNRTKTSKRGLSGLGSDAARIAKLRRVERGKKPKCRKSSIPSRPFQRPCTTFPPGKRKIPSRPFPNKNRGKSEE